MPVELDPTLVKVLLGPWSGLGAFLWGLLWGSFANVVIWRVPRGQSVVYPGSRCGACERPIPWYDNIPLLSYLLLRGRCRACKAPFSGRYLIVELLGGLLSFTLYTQHVATPMIAGGAPALAAWLLWFVFGLALVIVTFIDLDFWIIPDGVVLPLAGLGLVVAGLAPDVLGVTLLDGALAAGLGFTLLAALRWLYLKRRGIEALGLGDAKLLLMVGAFCGNAGLLWTISAGAVQGLLISIPLLLLGRRVANRSLEEVHGDDPELGEEDPDAGVMGVRVPFGPFLALAAIEFMILGEPIRALIQRLLL
ncbi:MAG: prepilin peptidase [Myxococcales bacterium]|nr:prepilin peptidase [Myxococcales bacterium]MCB9755525.1 prepilin peptidase [Myxococcales bacterium]